MKNGKPLTPVTTQNGPAAPEKRPVEAQLEWMDSTINRLCSLTESLTARLDPYLMPYPPNTVEQTDASHGGAISPLGQSLGHMLNRLCELENELTVLYNRVER